MAEIGFIGLGNMGGPMMRNLLKAGHSVAAFDLSEAACRAAADAGAKIAASPGAAAAAADIVVTMLPAGRHVRQVYLGEDGVIANAKKGALLADSSTIDVDTARAVAKAAEEAGLMMVDAPVSGGVAGAEAATLTFMVGGSDAAFAKAEPILQAMGKAVIHAGPAGNGQAAKMCNNLMLGIQMLSVCEAMTLAERLGLDAQTLFDISSKASGQCWSLTSYCPEPGPVPNAPSNRDYKPGFAAAMMLKDLRLAVDAAQATETSLPMGGNAANLYSIFCSGGGADLDFSGIIRMIKSGRAKS